MTLREMMLKMAAQRPGGTTATPVETRIFFAAIQAAGEHAGKDHPDQMAAIEDVLVSVFDVAPFRPAAIIAALAAVITLQIEVVKEFNEDAEKGGDAVLKSASDILQNFHPPAPPEKGESDNAL